MLSRKSRRTRLMVIGINYKHFPFFKEHQRPEFSAGFMQEKEQYLGADLDKILEEIDAG
ncbi:MAG: hypothetical protein KJ573_13890 [Proteobacteria bacterium]|nr:hypothetical protein [Pseudomonadota bacterium]MBU1904666.1 hypothetical protein [Pseudomonadota bacterium]